MGLFDIIASSFTTFSPLANNAVISGGHQESSGVLTADSSSPNNNDVRNIVNRNCKSPVLGGSYVDEIAPGVFLGDKCVASSYKLLKRLGITHVVNCTHDLPNSHPDRFEYLQIPLVDGSLDPPLYPSIDTAVSFMEDAVKNGGNTFVHCFAGMSRSASVVTAYLMKTNCWTLNEALEHVKRHRLIASPNQVFLPQLYKYEKQLFQNDGYCTGAFS